MSFHLCFQNVWKLAEEVSSGESIKETVQKMVYSEEAFTFQLAVMDTAGQRSCDNVSVTVLPMAFSMGVSLDRKMGTHTATAQPRTTGPSEDARWGLLTGEIPESHCPKPAPY
ncbi:hypothetical protein HPG69_010872, partial [Diceros bicornis minor]